MSVAYWGGNRPVTAMKWGNRDVKALAMGGVKFWEKSDYIDLPLTFQDGSGVKTQNVEVIGGSNQVLSYVIAMEGGTQDGLVYENYVWNVEELTANGFILNFPGMSKVNGSLTVTAYANQALGTYSFYVTRSATDSDGNNYFGKLELTITVV